jgi:hypothetical protein
MLTESTDEIHLELIVNDSVRRQFIEPEISRPVDVLESTLFFQVEVGGFDAAVDITD